MGVTLPKVDASLSEPKAQHNASVASPHASTLQGVGSSSGARSTEASALSKTAAFDAVHIETRSLLEHALRLDPSAMQPRVLLFLLELKERNFAQAEHIVTSLIQEHPSEPDYLAMHAELVLLTLNLPKARELSSQALKLQPAHVEAQRVKVLLDAVAGEQSSSERQLAKLIEHDDANQQLCFTVFQGLLERHRWQEAARLGQELQRIQPQNTALRSELIDIRILTHPFGVPLYAWRRAGRLAPVIFGFGALLIYVALTNTNHSLSTAFGLVCASLVAYLLIYPALMRRWFESQA